MSSFAGFCCMCCQRVFSKCGTTEFFRVATENKTLKQPNNCWHKRAKPKKKRTWKMVVGFGKSRIQCGMRYWNVSETSVSPIVRRVKKGGYGLPVWSKMFRGSPGSAG